MPYTCKKHGHHNVGDKCPICFFSNRDKATQEELDNGMPLDLNTNNIKDVGKETAEYIDRHIIESMKELAKEGFEPQIPVLSDHIADTRKMVTDDEITKQGFLHSYLNELPDDNALSWIQGAKWYREQLKLKK